MGIAFQRSLVLFILISLAGCAQDSHRASLRKKITISSNSNDSLGATTGGPGSGENEDDGGSVNADPDQPAVDATSLAMTLTQVETASQECFGVRIYLVDQNNTETWSEDPTSVKISGTQAHDGSSIPLNAFYSDSECQDPLSSDTVLMQPTQEIQLSARALTPGNYSLHADSANLASAAEEFTVTYNGEIKLRLFSPCPDDHCEVVSGSCYGGNYAALADSAGNAAPVDQVFTFNFAANSEFQSQVFSDSKCENPISSAIKIQVGQSESKKFWLRTTGDKTKSVIDIGEEGESYTITSLLKPAIVTLLPPEPSITATAGSCIGPFQATSYFSNYDPWIYNEDTSIEVPDFGETIYIDDGTSNPCKGQNISSQGQTAAILFKKGSSTASFFTRRTQAPHTSVLNISEHAQSVVINRIPGPPNTIVAAPLYQLYHEVDECQKYYYDFKDSYGNKTFHSSGSVDLTLAPHPDYPQTTLSHLPSVYSDSGCTSALSLPFSFSSSDSIEFYVKGTFNGHFRATLQSTSHASLNGVQNIKIKDATDPSSWALFPSEEHEPGQIAISVSNGCLTSRIQLYNEHGQEYMPLSSASAQYTFSVSCTGVAEPAQTCSGFNAGMEIVVNSASQNGSKTFALVSQDDATHPSVCYLMGSQVDGDPLTKLQPSEIPWSKVATSP